MPLTPGTRLGSYEVVATLGAGGMGEVYRARDTRLERHVALKLVLEAFVADADRAMRFEREAKTLAALNHPNIATLHGLEQADGRHFLVMEFVDGETLAERIARRPAGLPLDDVLRIACQIAEALEAAHEKAIVHRDLKPANVKITPDDKAKVLDFGLARVAEGDGASSSIAFAQSPTFTSPAITNAGVILGTASYMSPEQARGYTADHRSDIFSFGVVLYEMLTGRQPFPGETISDVLASVLARDPDLAALPADLSPRLIDLIKRCLEKNPKKRWQAIGDVRYELESLVGNPRAGAPVAQAAAALPQRPLWLRALPYAAVALGAAALAAIPAWTARPLAPAPVVRFSIHLPQGQSLGLAGRLPVGVSPDGKSIAYIVNRELYVRRLDDLQSSRILANEARMALSHPVFSPDGQAIAFRSGPAIARMPAGGGSPITVTPAEDVSGLTWQDDWLLYGAQRKILRVKAAGGQAETLVELAADETPMRPQLLPDGRTILYTVAKGTAPERWADAVIVAQRIGEATRTTIIEGGADARYLSSGHLVYATRGVLFAVPFDASSLAVGGAAVPVIEGISRGAGIIGGGVVHFASSDAGTIVYVPGSKEASATLVLSLVFADRNGNLEVLKAPDGAHAEPRLSPNGRYVAFSSNDGKDTSLWIHDVQAGGSPRRLTFGASDSFPVWSSDSTRVTYVSQRGTEGAIYRQRADGTDVPEQLTKPESGVSHVPYAWSPDGSVLLFDIVQGEAVSLMMLASDGRITPFGGVTSRTYTTAAFSPDGRWVTYSTRSKGNPLNLVYVQPFPATGAMFQVSKRTEDGHHPVWSADGQEIYYTPGPGAVLVAVPVSTAPAFALGEPVMLNRLFSNQAPSAARPFDVAPKGGFVGLASRAATDPTIAAGGDLHVVVNFFEELKAKVGSR